MIFFLPLRENERYPFSNEVSIAFRENNNEKEEVKGHFAIILENITICIYMRIMKLRFKSFHV